MKKKKKQNIKIHKKRKPNRILAAIGGDMRNLAVAFLGAGALTAVISNEPASNALVLFMATSLTLWVCGILLTAITQE